MWEVYDKDDMLVGTYRTFREACQASIPFTGGYIVASHPLFTS